MNGKNEDINKTIADIQKDLTFIKKTFKDPKFKNEIKRLKIKSWTYEKKVTAEKEEEDDMVLYNSFKATLDKIKTNSLEKFDANRRDNLNSKLTWLTVASGLLPLITAAITAGLLTVTESLLSFFANIIDVVPPIFLNMYKGQSQENYKGLELRARIDALIGRIYRLAVVKELKNQRANIDKTIEEIARLSSQLGSGS